MMTLAHQWVLACAALALVVPPAATQAPFGRGGNVGVGMLVENPDVQNELKLTEEQIKKWKAVNDQIRDKHKDDFARVIALKPEARAEFIRDMLKAMNEETIKALAGVLSAGQAKRLDQIDLQQRGAQAFLDAPVQKTLMLTDDQKEQIDTITADASKVIREAGAKGGKPEDFGKKMVAMRKETMERVM